MCTQMNTVSNRSTLTNEYRHLPVMLNEVLNLLQLQPGQTVVDCTLGGAGHALPMAREVGSAGFLIGIDQDDSALQTASMRFAEARKSGRCARFIASRGNFGDLDYHLQQACVVGIDAILFDLGVSSPQLDWGHRGFSYHEEAPLDMRMDPRNQRLTAHEVINSYTVADLTRIISSFGEERFAQRIARNIDRARRIHEIETTTQLADLVKQAIPAATRRTGKHPARRTFQAIRMEVNDELGVLERGLQAALRWLKPSGRIAVISYHSLEDRMVKRLFKEESQRTSPAYGMPIAFDDYEEEPILRLVTKKPVLASENEIEDNPRARSAKLRVAEKTHDVWGTYMKDYSCQQ